MHMGTVQRSLVVALAAVGLMSAASCSTSADDAEPVLLEPTPEEDSPTGSLEVRFTYGERTSMYAEGARHYLQVLDDAGAVNTAA